MPKDIGWTIDSNFVVSGFGIPGPPIPPQPTLTDASKFITQGALDTAIATVHKAADLPYLTVNDKVFAARSTVVVLSPKSEEVVEEVSALDFSYDEEDEPTA